MEEESELVLTVDNSKNSLEEAWKQLRIDGLKLQTGEDEISKIFGICKRCNKSPIRNYCYNYCPECMNEFIIESGGRACEWIKGPDNILIGKD